MQNFGCEKGKTIFFLTNNTADSPALVLAFLSLGCQITGLPVCCSKAECKYFLSLTKPQFVFGDVEFYQMLRECMSDLSNNAAIFTFNGQIDASLPVDVLFEECNMGSCFE